MFRVTADSLRAYFDFDPKRKAELVKLDALMSKVAPGLRRHFHQGTPAGTPGMRMKMIGYGRSSYAASSGEIVAWPVVGVALQKNYISVYLAVSKDGKPLLEGYTGKLGECRAGHNNFSFERFDGLNVQALSALLAEAAAIHERRRGRATSRQSRRSVAPS